LNSFKMKGVGTKLIPIPSIRRFLLYLQQKTEGGLKLIV
jgi:hypothetical protein